MKGINATGEDSGNRDGVSSATPNIMAHTTAVRDRVSKAVAQRQSDSLGLKLMFPKRILALDFPLLEVLLFALRQHGIKRACLQSFISLANDRDEEKADK